MIKTIAAAALTLAFAVSLTACLMLWTRYAPGASPVLMFADAHMIPKLVMMLCMLLLVLAAILALMPDRSVRGVLVALAVAGPALGGLAALLSLTNIRMVEARVGGHVSFAVKAPSYAELLLTLSFGLLVGAVAALGLLRRRA
jgi:hypothetical protein